MFSSTATAIQIRFNMTAENGDWLWAINGHSGIDVYVQDDATGGEWWWATSSGNNPGNGAGSMAQTVLDTGRGHLYGNFDAGLDLFLCRSHGFPSSMP